jgi:hypothetical protein
MKPGIAVKVVFVRHRHKKNELERGFAAVDPSFRRYSSKNFDCCHKFHQKATGRLGCPSALLHQVVIA